MTIMSNGTDYFVGQGVRKSENYFSRVLEGQSEIYRTPFFQEGCVDLILDNWFNYAKEGFRSVPGLAEFEAEMKSKVGPLSVMKPLAERMDDIKLYYTAIRKPSVPIDPKAITAFIATLKGMKVPLRDARGTAENMRLSTNSGAPFFTKRREVLEDTFRMMAEGTAKYYDVAILGWRGQEGGPEVDDIKQRVVWMFNLMRNITELQFYQPAIEAWQRQNINSAYISMNAVEDKITRCFDTKGDNYVVGTDFSKFDQHFNEDLQLAALEIIKSMITGYDGHKWLEEVFPRKFDIPLVVQPDLVFTGKHGMGSGSGGTNFDECCAHGALQHEVALKQGAILNPFSNAYGDDGYLSYDGIDVDDVIESYTSHGQDMNVDKQHVSKHSAIYLRRYFHDAYRDNTGKMLGIYSTCRALGRLMYQERYYRWSDEVDYYRYVTLRAWSIIENCNRHPLFDEFVKYVVNGDKYRLGLSIPGFMETFQSDFDKLRILDPDVMGYTKTLQSEATGVKEWRVYKTLMSMR